MMNDTILQTQQENKSWRQRLNRLIDEDMNDETDIRAIRLALRNDYRDQGNVNEYEPVRDDYRDSTNLRGTQEYNAPLENNRRLRLRNFQGKKHDDWKTNDVQNKRSGKWDLLRESVREISNTEYDLPPKLYDEWRNESKPTESVISDPLSDINEPIRQNWQSNPQSIRQKDSEHALSEEVRRQNEIINALREQLDMKDSERRELVREFQVKEQDLLRGLRVKEQELRRQYGEKEDDLKRSYDAKEKALRRVFESKEEDLIHELEQKNEELRRLKENSLDGVENKKTDVGEDSKITNRISQKLWAKVLEYRQENIELSAKNDSLREMYMYLCAQVSKLSPLQSLTPLVARDTNLTEDLILGQTPNEENTTEFLIRDHDRAKVAGE